MYVYAAAYCIALWSIYVLLAAMAACHPVTVISYISIHFGLYQCTCDV